MEFSEVLREPIMNLSLDARDKKDAIEKMAELLYRDGAISSKQEYIDDVFFRETKGPTGIGNYIAIPHGKSGVVEKTSVTFAKLNNPIEWETLDGNPVKLIFLFAVPNKNCDRDHLKLLSHLAAALAHDKSQKALLYAEKPDQVVEIFKFQKTSV